MESAYLSVAWLVGLEALQVEHVVVLGQILVVPEIPYVHPRQNRNSYVIFSRDFRYIHKTYTSPVTITMLLLKFSNVDIRNVALGL